MNPKLRFFVLCCVLIVLFSASAFSEEKYPSKPINLYIGFSPGGSTDLTARVIGDQMAAILGQPLVPINKPGGATTVEATLLSQAKPDGYT
ncbi:MAG: tripartite tricarboxylate transporter substrate-binding protein, partial [Deltaproteobacteria bacterium]|nr:tripartite tricarboxylate transporter substrate-binding protein [Deltaproteobacteria bacterium]